MPNPSDVRRIKGTARHTLHQLLLVDAVRYLVVGARRWWFVRIRRRLRTLAGGDAVAEHTVMHNLRGMRDLAVNRSLHLARPLSVIEWLKPDSDILVVGPRTEGELLTYLAHGFERRSVRAVDLISYSPWVDLGDLHRLPYEDASFDAVVLGWVLAYSRDPRRAAAEVRRVLRTGGIVAAAVEWNRRSDSEIVHDVGYLPGSDRRLASCDEILELFAPVGQVLVRHEAEAHNRGQTAALVVIFTVET